MKTEDQERDSGRAGNRGGNSPDNRRQNMSNSRGGSNFNPAENLDEAARRRGGQRSAEMQQRDERGHFAGKKSTGGPTPGGRGGGNR